MKVSTDGRLPVLRVAALTVAAVFIHGYHLGVEDAEIYLPAARWFRHPQLYPLGREFFLSHAHLSIFGPLVAWTGRLTHLSMDWTFFAWYVATLFATIAGSWLFAAACFESSRARWSAVLLMTAVLTMPVANTGLLIVDPYLTARSFSTPLTLFGVACVLERRFAWAAVTLALTAAIHPQMAVYLVFLIVVLWVAEANRNRVRTRVPAMASAVGVIPTQFHFSPASGPYREALFSRDYFFLYNWSWYHWLGLLGPLAFLLWFWKADLRGTRPAFKEISFALIPFGLISIAAAVLLCSTPSFQMFVRLQPLRSYDLIYLIFVLLLGGVAGEFLARGRPWVVAAMVLPLAAGMFVAARQTYPHSPQIELPSSTSPNPWVNTLLWIRHNTPTDAVFAVDSRYFKDPVVDVHGFRAISERSDLADYYKDGGVVSLFPNLAVKWKEMSDATYGLNHFSLHEFRWLKREYPAVTWTVIHGSAPAGMDCPYERDSFSVCQMPGVLMASSKAP
jgi:hypothetical protein